MSRTRIMNMPPVVLGTLVLLLGLALPLPGNALTKEEVRERSLKRLERVSEDVKTLPPGQDPSGVSLGRPFPTPGVPAPEPAAPPPPRPSQTGKPGRASERKTDEAVIATTPSDVPEVASRPATEALPASAAQSAQSAPASAPASTPASTAASAPASTAGTPVPAVSAGAATPQASGPQTPIDPAQRAQALELFRQALAASKKNNHKKALEFLDKALAIHPTDPDSLNHRGNAHNNLGDQKKALADYDTAVSLRPNDAALLSNRGLAHERMGDDAAACRDYRAACGLGDCTFFDSFKKEGRCPE